MQFIGYIQPIFLIRDITINTNHQYQYNLNPFQ